MPVDERNVAAQVVHDPVHPAHLKRVEPNASYARVIATTLEGFRNWDRDSRREDGGAPGAFDSTAAEYMLAHGLSMHALVDIFSSRADRSMRLRMRDW